MLSWFCWHCFVSTEGVCVPCPGVLSRHYPGPGMTLPGVTPDRGHSNPGQQTCLAVTDARQGSRAAITLLVAHGSAAIHVHRLPALHCWPKGRTHLLTAEVKHSILVNLSELSAGWNLKILPEWGAITGKPGTSSPQSKQTGEWNHSSFFIFFLLVFIFKARVKRPLEALFVSKPVSEAGFAFGRICSLQNKPF